MFGKPAATQQSVPQGLFGNKSGLGQAQPTQPQFGTQTSIFGNPTPIGGSVFGGSKPVQQPTSQPSNNPFGSVPTSSAGTGMFGQQQPQQNSQQQPQPFQQSQPPTGLFGKPIAQSTPLIPPGGGPFNTQATQPATSQPTGTGLFGKGPAPPTGLFGKPATGTPAPSLFGGASQLPQASATQQSQRDGVYTPLDQLTEEEKNQFTAGAFDLGRIPIRPPPREMV